MGEQKAQLAKRIPDRQWEEGMAAFLVGTLLEVGTRPHNVEHDGQAFAGQHRLLAHAPRKCCLGDKCKCPGDLSVVQIGRVKFLFLNTLHDRGRLSPPKIHDQRVHRIVFQKQTAVGGLQLVRNASHGASQPK
jgi:hypothetical protein